MQRVAIFEPPQAGKAWRDWKTANAEALARIPADAIRIDVGRDEGGGTYITVFVDEDWLTVLAAARER